LLPPLRLTMSANHRAEDEGIDSQLPALLLQHRRGELRPLLLPSTEPR
jgi:hypothetical protein